MLLVRASINRPRPISHAQYASPSPAPTSHPPRPALARSPAGFRWRSACSFTRLRLDIPAEAVARRKPARCDGDVRNGREVSEARARVACRVARLAVAGLQDEGGD